VRYVVSTVMKNQDAICRCWVANDAARFGLTACHKLIKLHVRKALVVGARKRISIRLRSAVAVCVYTAPWSQSERINKLQALFS